MQKKRVYKVLYHIIVAGLGFAMLYPVVWMLMSSFKPSETVLNSIGLWPTTWTLSNYTTGWRGFGGLSFGVFFRNSFIIAFLNTIGAAISSSLVGYGLGRFKFRGRNFLFTLVLFTMMLPAQILMVPRYLWFNLLGWVGTYLPLTIPAYFATTGFFVYLNMNFISGIPRDLDEAARIDGCSYYMNYFYVILPLSVPAFITSLLFSFMWTWEDYLGPLIYLNKSNQYTASLALKLFSDPTTSTDYGAIFAMSILSLVPILLIFIFFQQYLTEGISTTGLKG